MVAQLLWGILEIKMVYLTNELSNRISYYTNFRGTGLSNISKAKPT